MKMMKTSSCAMCKRRRVTFAVSCPWRLPDYENSAIRKYHVREDVDLKIKIPQDVVLDRVVKFAATKKYPIWIDKLCIDQEEDSDEKQIAFQSVDLVYKQSKISLGLLFVRLDSKEQVRCLHALLCGKCATQEADRHGNVKYVLTTDNEEAREVLNVVNLIVEGNFKSKPPTSALKPLCFVYLRRGAVSARAGRRLVWELYSSMF